MFKKNHVPKEEWRDGVFLCTVYSTLEGEIIESKLRAESIPCIKLKNGAGDFMEIAMGFNSIYPIDIYVHEASLNDAKEIIVATPLTEDEINEYMDQLEAEEK